MIERIMATFWFHLRLAVRHRPLWMMAGIALFGSYYFFSFLIMPPDMDLLVGDVGQIKGAGIYALNLMAYLRVFPILAGLMVLASLFITLDFAGRFQQRLLSNILFTKPITTMELHLGRYLAAVVVLGLFTLLPMASLLYHYSKHRYLPWSWEDFAALWTLGLLMPVLVASAIAWGARSIFHNIFVAAIFSLTLLLLSHHTSALGVIPPFQFLERGAEFYFSPLGFHFPPGWVARFLVLNLWWFPLALAASCYYTRRVIPDRVPAPPSRIRALDTPTFRAILAALPPDRRVEKDAFGLLLVSILFIVGIAGFLYQEHASFASRNAQLEREYQTLIANQTLPGQQSNRILTYLDTPVPESLHVVHYDLELDYAPSRNQLASICTIQVACHPPDAATEVAFLLNPGLMVDSVEERNANSADEDIPGVWTPASFRKIFNHLYITPSADITADSTREFRIQYAGRILKHYFTSIGSRRLDQYPELDYRSPVWSLKPENLFYPILMVSPTKDEAIRLRRRFYMARITPRIHGQKNVAVIGPGTQTGESLVSSEPLSLISLMGGPFREYRSTILDIPVRFYGYPGRENTVRLFLTDLEWMIRDTLKYLGNYQIRELLFYDAPPEKQFVSGEPAIPISLDLLIQRKYTLDLLSSRFKRYLDRSAYLVYVTFSQAEMVRLELIQQAFQNIYPTGELNELLSTYLPMYFKQTFHVGTLSLSQYTHAPPPLHSQRYDVQPHFRQVYLPSIRELFSIPYHHQAKDTKPMALFHMLRYLLGEDGFRQLVAAYLERYRFQQVSFNDFRDLASEVAGENLDWFFDQWIDEPALPEYVLTRAEAWMFDDPATLGMDYEVALEVINEGTGRMQVPVFLRTEGDRIIRHLMLDTGERGEIRLTVPDRPVYATVDPAGWILQSLHQHDKKRVGRQDVQVVIHPPQKESFTRLP